MKIANIQEVHGGFHLMVEERTYPLASLEELPALIELLGVNLGETRFMPNGSKAHAYGDSLTIVDAIALARRNLRRLMIPVITSEA